MIDTGDLAKVINLKWRYIMLTNKGRTTDLSKLRLVKEVNYDNKFRFYEAIHPYSEKQIQFDERRYGQRKIAVVTLLH